LGSGGQGEFPSSKLLKDIRYAVKKSDLAPASAQEYRSPY
jgi:hypothetical protein